MTTERRGDAYATTFTRDGWNGIFVVHRHDDGGVTIQHFDDDGKTEKSRISFTANEWKIIKELT